MKPAEHTGNLSPVHLPLYCIVTEKDSKYIVICNILFMHCMF